MINDAEEGSMNNGQLTANSIAFANQLKARGFTNVLHYSMAAWFTEGVLSPTQLGTENIWIAQYPFEPTAISYGTKMKVMRHGNGLHY